MPRQNVASTLLRRSCLRVPVATPRSTRSTIPSASSSVRMPRSRWSPSASSTALGIPPMPTCSVAPSGIRSTIEAAIARSRSSGSGGRDLDQRPVGLAVAEQLGGVDLVEPERARHPLVDLEEERHLADQRRDVVGVGAEREVAGAVGRARGGEHDRVARAELAAAAASPRSGWARGRSRPPSTPRAWRPTGSRRRGAGGRRRRRGCTGARAARASGARGRPAAARSRARARRAAPTGSPLASGRITSVARPDVREHVLRPARRSAAVAASRQHARTERRLPARLSENW